jgi:multiple antibiotic resistance protein
MFTHPEAEFALLAFSSLFSVINPISAAPIFVMLTENAPEERRKVAWRACVAAAIILAVFAAAGGAIFAFFGITVPAFQIAGGIIFAAMSMRTLESEREEIPADDIENSDPSVVPIGIPLIAGPGAISTVMILIGQARSEKLRLALGSAIAANILLTFLILLAAPAIVTKIGPTGQRVINKVMGLITAVIGVQFVINGVTTVALSILRGPRG